MDNMLSASDVALLNDKNNGNWGDNSFMWIFALLLLFGGGFGGFGNKGCSPVTEGDLCSANSFQELKNMAFTMNDNLGKGICDLGYETARQFGDVEKQLAQCCCETQRSIDGVKFDMANYNAHTNATIVEQTQKVLDALAQNKIDALQAKVNDLERDKALCGIVKLPTTFTYPVNCNPFCNQPNYCNNGCY